MTIADLGLALMRGFFAINKNIDSQLMDAQLKELTQLMDDNVELTDNVFTEETKRLCPVCNDYLEDGEGDICGNCALTKTKVAPYEYWWKPNENEPPIRYGQTERCFSDDESFLRSSMNILTLIKFRRMVEKEIEI